ncbi:MAG: WD40 repeat domain-containing protein [Alphaproteobacteria bacterium]|nr:WD40 repeat domain-containing protein [Alphaproteobacteria bacterium]
MVCGERPKATGLIEITQLTKGELKVISIIENTRGVKSGTFAASPSSHLCFAFGDLAGNLSILDLEKEKVFWQAQAHSKVVNCVDGAGSEGNGYGPCEIVTGGRDGSVRIWDPRQKAPVISLDPA